MGKKTKIGKQRKDKFYKLAKETGYRSRASFKLIQLNRKFEFLPNARVLIDLCAAPGGWLQVAQQAMPVSSVIIGVDLVPIKPLKNIITLQDDITTDKCKQALKRELKTWKADVVLHDGAPNIGTNWIQDAYSQNNLTLAAMKLASEMLMKGGWFITKIFRSKDYMSLVWVFKKLFKHVHITKPQASRSESAEIFVVCQGYLAPDRIDPKFLNESHVFKEVPLTGETKASIAKIVKPRRKAEGYDEETGVFQTLKATEFIFCDNHLERLCKCSEIVLDDDDIRDHKLTTEAIKVSCKDIKVLGKADLKAILNWRKQLREAIESAAKKDDPNDKESKDLQTEETEIETVLKEADQLETSKLQDAKRKKKRILKERKKVHDRINLKMIIKDDEPIIDEDFELFKLSQIKSKKDLTQIEDDTNLEFGLEDPLPENDDSEVFVNNYRKTHIPYDRHKQAENDIVEDKEQSDEYSSDEGLSSDVEFESEEEMPADDETVETILEGQQNPLAVDLVERPVRVKDTVNKWFATEDFEDDSDVEDNDLELDLLAENYEKSNRSKNAEVQSKTEEEGTKTQDEVQSKDEEEGTEPQVEVQDEEEGTKYQDKHPKGILKKDTNGETKKRSKKRVRLDAEGLALGSMMVQSKKMKRDIIENGYNRYASNDENLPSWFVADEKKHYRKNVPVTAEMVREYKARMREINARPIKKVVEAKARKKKRAVRRMEKAKHRAEKVTEQPDISEKEKVMQLKEIYKKALKKPERNIAYVVCKKGGKGKVRRPAGAKGRYKTVDARMRKDDRKQKLLMKSKKKEGKRNMKQKGNARQRGNKGQKGRQKKK